MNINIDITGTIGEGKTAVCYLLEEFFKDLNSSATVLIDDSNDKFDPEQWRKYKTRFKEVFEDKELNVNIKTREVKKEGIL